MPLVVFRHGNTFAPGAPCVCAGRQPGLPLVEAGWQQAHAAGAVLQAAPQPRAWLASPRLRAHQFAEGLQAGGRAWAVAAHQAADSWPIATDERLDEIDYGPWTGRTRSEIVAAGGGADVQAWDEQGLWPGQAQWGQSEAQVIAEVRSFAAAWSQRVADGELVVAVSHAGRMRYLLNLLAQLPTDLSIDRARRVRCGHAVVLGCHNQSWQLLAWNAAPAELGRVLAP